MLTDANTMRFMPVNEVRGSRERENRKYRQTERETGKEGGKAAAGGGGREIGENIKHFFNITDSEYQIEFLAH